MCRWHPDLKLIALRFANVMDEEDYARFPDFDADASARRWNLWGYVDGPDAAQALRRSLEHDQAGFDSFIVAAADTVMTRDNRDLVAEGFPDVRVRGDIAGNGTLHSIDKARHVLWYVPERSWR